MRSSFAVATLLSCANAFWGMGHLLVARQAQELLEQKDAAALQKALDVLAPFAKNHPDLIKSEKDHPFTECATFADEIKDEDMGWQSDWHFVDQPYLDQGGKLSDFDFTQNPEKVCDALDALTKFLKDDKTSLKTSYVKTIQQNFSDESDQKSFALRLIIHYTGDIHQPLHTVSAVDKKYPQGDMGGNLEHFPDLDPATGVNELHALWDSVIYDYPGYPTLPFTEKTWNEYTSIASDMWTTYPPDEDKLLPNEFEKWADEGLEIAKEAVYDGFTPGKVQTDEYLKRAEPLLKGRMMFASARLADIIIDIYGDKSDCISCMIDEMIEAFLQ